MTPSRGCAVIAGWFAIESFAFGISGRSRWVRRSSRAAILADKAAEHVDVLDAPNLCQFPDRRPVQTLGSHGPYPALREGVGAEAAPLSVPRGGQTRSAK